MQKLVIAEKPSVAQSIAKVLGVTERKDGYLISKEYIVSWCVGHLVGLASPDTYDEKYKKWTFETLPIIPDNWQFIVNAATKKQFDILRELMKRDSVDELVCATDAGREGECIFRYVYYKAGCKKPFKRLWVSSLEESAIRDGFNSLKNGREYDNLYAAGLCRAKSDWLVGMNASRLFSIRYNARLNIGRVQTPTLAMIVQRDYEVEHFVKQKYFTAVIDCGTFTAATERIDSEEEAKSIADKCNGKNAAVASVKKEIKTVNPPKLFDLTTLQREANRQYGYTAQQTLDFTQSLYEKKLCTYPRTDSQYITDDMKETAENMVALVCRHIPCCNGIIIASPDIKRITNNKKVSDHHALLPTAQIASADLNVLSDGESNILSLIAAKLICAVSEPHKYEAVKVTLKCEETDFTANGKTIVADGWKKLEARTKSLLKGGEDKEEAADETDKSLPELTEGQIFENVQSSVAEHWTSPPKPYTEDTLLKAMETAGNKDYDEDSDIEKKGLGTPATRAAIIENLVKREYVERKKKQLTATKRGVSLIEVVPEEVKSAKMTADWESELQAIEKGRADSAAFMQSIQQYVVDICSNYSSVAENAALRREQVIVGKCPRCGKNVVEYKASYSCESGKDGCGFTLWKAMKIPQTVISAKAAAELLSKGVTELKAKSKEGKEYTANFRLEDTGTYVNLVFVQGERTSIGKCPKCGEDVFKGKSGFYCGGKCGMFLGKVFGKELTESQLKKLLGGKSVTLTIHDKKTMVLPEVAENEYQGRPIFSGKHRSPLAKQRTIWL